MKKPFLLRSFAALAASALLLAGCGGGGGGSSNPSLTGSALLEGGVAGCSLDTQKKFIRTYMDEVYFWYREIPEVDPAKFSTVEDYFHALLVTTPDANGVPKDRFSAVLPVSQARNVLQQSAAPLQADATSLLAANRTNAVPKVNVFTTTAGRVTGYIQFNDHIVGAQDDLITAFRAVQAGGAQDLVLDLRFNTGGFLYIAQSAASMVTGPGNEGRVFEQLQYNDKRPQETASSALFFRTTVEFADGINAQYPVGTALPQLNLPRLFVLTTDDTCSASESIINSLRGIDVQVIRIGTTTCGKPYGFRQKNNCGLAYFPIEFKGTNAKGFGDYTTGFSPMCEVSDTHRTVPAGDPGDPLLDAAKFYLDHGACPAGTGTGVQSAATPIVTPQQAKRPAWAGRLLLPQQQP